MRSWLLCCSVVVFLTISVPQRAGGQVLYDNFNALNRLIDVNKWAGFETEWRGLEAHRRIDAGKLRLTARGAGLLSPSTGTASSDFGLYHPNANSVTLWQTTAEVVDFDAQACPANTTPGEARALLRGAFFNSGTPIPNNITNDVLAQMQIVRRSNAAVNTVVVEASMFRCTNADCSGVDNVKGFSMGTIPCPGRVCPPIILRIIWEPALNRFRFLRGPVPGIPNVAEQIATYTLADAKFAGLRSRTLSVMPRPANCTAATGRKTAFMDVLFDNVLANVVNVGPTVAAQAGSEFDAIDLGENLGPGEIVGP